MRTEWELDDYIRRETGDRSGERTALQGVAWRRAADHNPAPLEGESNIWACHYGIRGSRDCCAVAAVCDTNGCRDGTRSLVRHAASAVTATSTEEASPTETSRWQPRRVAEAPIIRAWRLLKVSGPPPHEKKPRVNAPLGRRRTVAAVHSERFC